MVTSRMGKSAHFLIMPPAVPIPISKHPISFKFKPNRVPVPARGIVSIGMFGMGVINISQFGIGLFSLSQFTIAGFAVAQFAIAYSLIAQVGLFFDKGIGMAVANVMDLVSKFY